MNQIAKQGHFGVFTEPATLRIERLLPGPLERVWAFLTESELRARWLASGEMQMKLEAPFELVWRNDTLTNPPGKRPEGFGEEHRMQSRITEIDPPRKIAFTWGNTGGVTFELEPRDQDVLLIVTHRRVTERAMLRGVSTGWHAHLDLLAARLKDEQPAPFWDGWQTLRDEYDRRLPPA